MRRPGPQSPNIVGHLHAMESCRHTDRAGTVQVHVRASCGLKRCYKSRMRVLPSAVGCWSRLTRCVFLFLAGLKSW
jgi:hypothetical protein